MDDTSISLVLELQVHAIMASFRLCVLGIKLGSSCLKTSPLLTKPVPYLALPLLHCNRGMSRLFSLLEKSLFSGPLCDMEVGDLRSKGTLFTPIISASMNKSPHLHQPTLKEG